MFVYSLAGLQVDGDALPEVELEDNETTARTGVYQILARLVAVPEPDVHAKAVANEWSAELASAGKLLAFPFDFAAPEGNGHGSFQDFQAEFLRVFEVGDGTDGPPAPIYGGLYAAGRLQRLEEVVRFYEYFGLSVSAEDPRPADHIATELEFMKYLTFKEAVSSSPRLQVSFRRAQHDFLERQLCWTRELAERTRAAHAGPFWQWATSTVAGFVAADAAYVSGVLAQ
jgi:DMSO reductase family type II enzyme chaperone